VPNTVRPNRNTARQAGSPLAAARWRVLAALGWNYRDVIGVCVAVAAGGAVLANVLVMQTGQHPAPLFRSELAAGSSSPAKPPPGNPPFAKEPPPAAVSPPASVTQPAAAPPAHKSEPAAPPRAGAEIAADIQRELARRGYYDGVVDGRYGPRTIAAIRDFEQTTGMKPGTEPNEALLQVIKRSAVKPSRPTTTASTGGASGRPIPPLPVGNDAIATVLAPSKRVIALQRALSDFGYGQIKPTGVVDADTQAAIEKFERERRLPVTGQPSDRVVRELAAIIGRPLE
jgi:peptidoglycan hydrolase-like protein with peptidoglycan-binding domain